MKAATAGMLMLVLLVSGCAFMTSLPGMPKTTTTSSDKQFVGGSGGIKAEIIKPSEDSKVYSNINFKAVTRLENTGEADAEGSICLTGLTPTYFTGFNADEATTFRLAGKKLEDGEIKEGESDTFEKDFGAVNFEEGMPDKFTISAITRYNYKSYATFRACITKYSYKEKGRKGCIVEEKKNLLGSSSAAPLKIASITEEIIPTSEESSTVALNIEIRNEGSGRVVSKSAVGSCEKSPKEEGHISIRLINAPGSASCTSATAKDDKKKITARCELTGVSMEEDYYEPEITAELDYAYEVIDSKNFEVVKK